MSAGKRMQPVADLARQQAETAAHSVADCGLKYTVIRKQLDELLSYRNDYEKCFREMSNTGLNAVQIKDYRIFMNRLDEAIEQQHAVLNSAGNRLSASKQVWIEKQQRVKAIGSVVSRYQQSERRKQVRRDQNESDEHAQRILARQDPQV